MTLDQAGSELPEVSAVPTDNRREDMLRAALHVIAERGFTDTRIADVAERAGTSPALVIYYFQSKDNLLTEAIRLAEDRWIEQGVERMQAIPDAVGRLEEIVTWICIPLPDDEFPEPWSLWIDLWARSLRHPEVARVREEFDARWRSAIARAVIDGQAEGAFGPNDPTEFAIALLALLDGLAVQVALGDPAVDTGFALRTAMGFASRVLGFTWSGDPVGTGSPST
jgi:AcrR family transcriptional regulator